MSQRSFRILEIDCYKRTEGKTDPTTIFYSKWKKWTILKHTQKRETINHNEVKGKIQNKIVKFVVFCSYKQPKEFSFFLTKSNIIYRRSREVNVSVKWEESANNLCRNFCKYLLSFLTILFFSHTSNPHSPVWCEMWIWYCEYSFILFLFFSLP